MRGTSERASFISVKIRMIKEKVLELVNKALSEKPSIFLIYLVISETNKIVITLDGDNGVTLQDCIDVSRNVEHNLDRDEFDFSLEVTSIGIDSELKLTRQYQKNIGRKLNVDTIDGNKIEAIITNANQDFITLEWASREPKKIGKGKETITHKKEIPYSEIKSAKVMIVF